MITRMVSPVLMGITINLVRLISAVLLDQQASSNVNTMLTSS